MAANLFLLALLAMASSHAFAADPSQLQDFCIADMKSPVVVNGFVCKKPMDVTADDFFFSGINKPGNTDNKLGSNVSVLTVAQLPGLNTLGITVGRVDFAPYGVNPPHFHPRATEVTTVVEGTLYVGFVTSDPNNKFFMKKLNKGDVFIFPQGLIHFEFNMQEKENAAVMVSFSSQFPGVSRVGNTVFGAMPPINDELLAKAFQLDKEVIDFLQKQTWI